MCKEETGHREYHLNLWSGAASRAPAGVAGLKLKRGMCTEETGHREDHLNLYVELRLGHQPGLPDFLNLNECVIDPQLPHPSHRHRLCRTHGYCQLLAVLYVKMPA